MNLDIDTIDLIIIVVYLVGILLVGILSVRLRKMTSEGYFLAGRGLGRVMVGAALFASNISTVHLVGLAKDRANWCLWKRYSCFPWGAPCHTLPGGSGHEGLIVLLPALPKEWYSGEFHGLCTRGAFELDMQWESGAD